MDKKMYSTTKERLIATPLPQQTRSYKPVSNQQLIDLTLEGIEKSGFVLDKELYSFANDGNQSNGRYVIKSVSDNEMSLMVGWQNSYDKSLSLKFAVGAHIFICSNGSVVGDMGTFKKKHVGEVQVFAPEKIREYISNAGELFRTMQLDKERMKEVEMTKRTSAELVGRMFLEENIITSTQLNIIKREMENPSYDYKADGSLWQLYNHTTHALKETHPSLWFKQHAEVHNFVTQYIS